MDVIIDDLGYDGKHSYEDTILPVEGSFEKYGGRIAICGDPKTRSSTTLIEKLRGGS